MTRKTKVLLVEDNPDERTIYAAVLHHKGYEVLETATAEEALDIVREHRPELIVTDLALPSVSGLALLQILRGSHRTAGTPVVAISCHEDLLAQAAEYDCAARLTKPFEPLRLAEELAKHHAG